MSIAAAILLGVVQGLTEFIPVSSSAHLVLVPYLLGLGLPPEALAFDVALHMGTVAALAVYFRAELAALARGFAGGSTPEARLYRRIGVLVLVGTVPAAVAGATAKEFFEEAFRSPLMASLFLFVTAALLVGGERLRDRRVAAAAAMRPAEDERVWTGDWIGHVTLSEDDATLASGLPAGEDAADPQGRTLRDVGVRDAVLIGLSQALALFPGVSRSGATITAGMATGLTREAATRFSFLLALPALLGAGVVSLGDLRDPGATSWTAIAAGTFAAFVAGYLAIRYLIAFVARDRLTGFARYCVGAGVVGLLGYAMIGPPGSM